jgi:peptidoglycan/LPS O-acetylase OafA/YrhL
MLKKDLDNPILKKNIGYIPALDGLRAIAVMLVLFTHANFFLGSNGFLGVDMFFVISGFLITTLLLEENKKRNKISLKAFYIRRTLRLFPALYLLCFIVFIYAIFFRHGHDKISIFQEVYSSLLYVNNISWYWDWGKEGLLLGHTWSLAIEEQFYLIWPWFILLALRYDSLKTLMLALIVFILTFKILYISGNVSDLIKSLIYESIYIGCLTALIRWVLNINFKIPDFVALILIGIILTVGLLPINFYKEIHNLYGQTIIALITSIIILIIINNPEGFTSKLLSTPAMVWVGKISYGLYLWHVPIFKIFKYHSTFPPTISFVLKFALTFLFATLSWMIIEKKSTEFGRKLSKKILDSN